MGSPTFIGHTSASLTAAGTGPLAVSTHGSVANGDLQIMHVAVASGNGVPSTPGGWSKLADIVSTSVGYNDGYLFGRLASSEPGSYNVSVSASSEYNVGVDVWRPSSGSWASLAEAIASINTRADTAVTSPNMVGCPVPPGDYAVSAFLAIERGSTTVTQPSGYTLGFNPDSGGTGTTAVESASAHLTVAAGSIPATTWTIGNAADTSSMHVAIVDPGVTCTAIRSKKAGAQASSLTAAPVLPFTGPGDRLVIVINRTGSAAVTPPSGDWTQLHDATYNAGNDRLGVWELECDGTELDTTPTFTAASGTPNWAWWIVVYRDSGPVVVSVANDTSADTTCDIPALTMAAGIVSAFAASGAGNSLITTTPPTGYEAFWPASSTVNESTGTGGSSGDARLSAWWDYSAAGNPGATSCTQSNANQSVGAQVGPTAPAAPPSTYGYPVLAVG